MRALLSSSLPLSELMELGLHGLHPGLDVVPGVPRGLMMDRVHLVNVRHVDGVYLMNGRSLLSRRSGGRGRCGRTGGRIELVVSIDATGINGILQVADLRLVLKFEPPTNQRGRRRPVWRRSPFSHRAAAPRALILLGRVLATETRTAGSTFRRGLQVRRRGQFRRRPRVPGVSRWKSRPWSTSGLRRRRGSKRLNGHESSGLGVDRLQRWELLAVTLMNGSQLKVTRRGWKGSLPRRRLSHGAEVAEVERRPGYVGAAGRARQESRRRDRTDRGRYPGEGVRRTLMMMVPGV